MNRSFKYGDGFFETIRLANGGPTLWSFHVDRIQDSCRALKINVPTRAELENILSVATAGLDPTGDYKLRFTFYRAGEGTYFPEHVPSGFEYEVEVGKMDAHANSLFPTNSGDMDQMIEDIEALDPITIGFFEDGQKAFSSRSFIKSTSSSLYVAAAMHAQEMNWDDALVLGAGDHVIETSRFNIYAMFDDVIYTPPISSGCVSGVCRAYLVDRYEIIEEHIKRSELKNADLLFVSNALRGVQRAQLA